ncbi:TetR/AcrR family transcriptional regulator [Acinetobacter sp. 194]|uniref:TetR/AcrR family transcriptional regulator n=1 Tax=Acinetobacter shaoyimingii TaxID=2715164 RepID=UPI00140A14C7|nr:TetR/AcrR family transcriptional regulator [Acinetobacter shaoyimingii]NHB58975.1 TetR/AcrR family transcriptional regulator [Acinetobacter shaoyimingii]
MLFDEMKLPVQKRSKARLELVVEKTIQLIEEQGITACTIPEIAHRANLPKITIYQYFPTINHLFTLLIKRYLDEVQRYVSFQSTHYQSWKIEKVTRDLIGRVAAFYNQHKAASLLILGGPVHVDGFNLQEMVIEQIAQDLLELFSQHPAGLNFKKSEHVTYLIEIVFALMKHSFYKYGCISPEILNECIELTDLYIQHKIKS